MALVLAACGGGGSRHVAAAATTAPASPAAAKRAYERKMQALGVQLAQSLAAIGQRNTESPARDAANLKAAIPKLRAVARKLAAIVPPAKVSAEHEQLRKAVLEFANELRGPIVRLEEGDLNGLGDVFSLKGVRRMETVSARIEKMGYQIVARPKRQGAKPK